MIEDKCGFIEKMSLAKLKGKEKEKALYALANYDSIDLCPMLVWLLF